jgi:hypothetical protein
MIRLAALPLGKGLSRWQWGRNEKRELECFTINAETLGGFPSMRVLMIAASSCDPGGPAQLRAARHGSHSGVPGSGGLALARLKRSQSFQSCVW